MPFRARCPYCGAQEIDRRCEEAVNKVPRIAIDYFSLSEEDLQAKTDQFWSWYMKTLEFDTPGQPVQMVWAANANWIGLSKT